MKKVLLSFIILLIVGAIFFIKKNDKEVKAPKIDLKKEPTFVQKNKNTNFAKKTIPLKVIPGEKKLTNKPFKMNLQNNIIDETTNDNFKDERREYIVLDKFKEIYPDMLVEIKKIPACLGKANSREEALNCHEIFSKVKRELAMITGDYEGEGNYSASGFIWDQERKEKMIEEVETTIPLIYEQKACVEEAESKIELEQCMEIE